MNLNGDEDGSTSGGYAKVMSDEFIKAEMELFAQQAKEIDIIITTALIPGKPAPKLITKEMVDSMSPGSVIVDMAAQQGVTVSIPFQVKFYVTDSGVKVIGYTDLPGRLPTQSSEMYATNLVNLAKLLCKEKDGNINIDFEDVILRNMSVIHKGEVTFPPPAISVTAAPAPERKNESQVPQVAVEKKPSNLKYVFRGNWCLIIRMGRICLTS